MTNETSTLADYALPVGRGYRLFIRGDRSDIGRLDGTVNDQNEVTIDMRGEVVQGDFSMDINYNDLGATAWDNGWNLIGNPYASALDWKTIYQDNALDANIEPIIWTYDPTINSYISYNALTESGTWGSGIIESGQSFWVKADGTANPIVFKEKYKSEQTTASRSARSEDVRDDELMVTLFKDSINEDGIIFKYVMGSEIGFDGYDILKFWGGELGIGFYNPVDTNYLSLNAQPVNYTKPLRLEMYYYVSESGTYTFKFSNSHPHIMSSAPQMYLYDRYTDEYTNVNSGKPYSFTVDMNIAAMIDTFRFSLVVLPSGPPTAQVNYFFGNGTDTSTVVLKWGSLEETIPTTYRVQRSATTSSFSTIATVAGEGAYNRASDYQYVDTSIAGYRQLFYRIAYTDSVTAQTMTTPMIMVDLTTGIGELVSETKNFSLYPNPVQTVLYLKHLKNSANQRVEVSVVDITGKQWMQNRYNGLDGLTEIGIPCDELPQGLYMLQLRGEDGSIESHRFIKE